MELIEKYSLELEVQFRLNIQPGFSINEFITRYRDKLSSVTNGMDDKNFPLEKDFDGEIDFCIFRMRKKICPTYKFLSDAKNEGYIFTGVKGVASLFLTHLNELPEDSWILSPNRTLSVEDHWEASAIPYLDHKPSHTNLHHSNHSVSDLRAGMYILLGKKVV